MRGGFFLLGLGLVVMAAVTGCAAQQQPPPPTAPAPATVAPAKAARPPAAAAPAKPAPAPTTAPAVATEADLEVAGFVDSPDGKLRVVGRASLLMSLRHAANPPPPPSGWRLLLPVFDVTAQDRQRRPVAELREALQLRFDVAAARPATVLVHRGGWQIVPSEVEADGRLSARIDHLTPYTVGAPSRGSVPAGAATPAATRPLAATPAAAPSAVPSRPATTPGAAPTLAITPGANATVAVATVSPATAESALGDAVKVLKGKSVRISSAAGYTGSIQVAIPPSLQSALGAALSAGGSGYYGLYNAVNEAITVQASGAKAAGSLTLLVEPKTSMPASADEARSQLQALFPGVKASLTQVQAASSAYLFYGVDGATAYSIGYLSYEGIPLAYALSGSGSYQPLVPRG